LLRRKPVLIPLHPWPAGTSTLREPDWSWRMTLLKDERLDGDRPPPARPKALPDNFSALPRLEQYKELLDRHLDFVKKNFFGRTFLFTNQVGLVRFSSTPAGLEASHEMHTIHPDQLPAGQPLPYTIHKSLLEPGNEAPPALR
jgi:hypothetical protein